MKTEGSAALPSHNPPGDSDELSERGGDGDKGGVGRDAG